MPAAVQSAVLPGTQLSMQMKNSQQPAGEAVHLLCIQTTSSRLALQQSTVSCKSSVPAHAVQVCWYEVAWQLQGASCWWASTQ